VLGLARPLLWFAAAGELAHKKEREVLTPSMTAHLPALMFLPWVTKKRRSAIETC
jgi:hypothetical protein